MDNNTARLRQAEGYQPKWDIDLKFGEQGQLLVVDIVEAFAKGLTEVKHEAQWLKTGNLYVELQCRKASGLYEKSGLAATEATLWVFVLHGTATAIIIPVGLLKTVVKRLYNVRWGTLYPYRKNCDRGSHPTTGVVIPLCVAVAHPLRRIPAQDELFEMLHAFAAGDGTEDDDDDDDPFADP